MECKSRATIKLASPFEDYNVCCEYGSSIIEKGVTVSPQDFLLFVSSSKLVDGSSVVLVGE
jgi:hypothetical protein